MSGSGSVSGRRNGAEGGQAGDANARLDRLVGQAKAAALWEAAWPVLWRSFGVVLVFLAVSWAGLWLDLAPGWRQLGLLLFALVFAGTLLPLVRLVRLDRRAALARLDREAAARDPRLAHGPASAVQDVLAVGAGDAGSRALWDLHRTRAAQAVASLRVGHPRPGMVRRDPYALRAGLVVAAVAALFVAGSEWRQRLTAAFDWQAPQPPGPNFRVDGWIDPPLYTRMPPLLLTIGAGDQRLRAPVNSQLIIRIAGADQGSQAQLAPGRGLVPVPGQAARPDLREERFRLAGSTDLTLTTPAGRQHLTVDAIPDRPPEVSLVGGPEVNGRGTFTLTYRAKDDYGIASAEGIVEPPTPGRTLVPPPRISLALPADASGQADTKSLVDLTDNPWAGATVRFHILVKDEAGQEGVTPTAEMTLPGRRFRDPLARSLAEERRRLVTEPDRGRARVQAGLDGLLVAPEMFTPQASVFLGLRTAASRLRRAASDTDLTEVADLLWEMALKIEDGDLSDAEKQLRQAQDRLKDAIDRNAPDDEIKRLTQDLKQALDKFLNEMAQKQSRDPGQQSQRGDNQNSKTVTPDDLNKMIQQMEDAMKRGDTAEAQRLMEQLRNILENLQTAQKGQNGNEAARQMQKQMRDLDQMTRDQQDLRDETFRDGQQQGQRQQNRGQQQQGQRGQQQQQGQQSAPGQQGQQGQKQGQQGKGDKQGSTGERQQALRERLQDLEQRMKENGMRGEQGLSDAEDAMREAEDALKQGKDGDAADAQGRALDGLKRGADGMAQQMQDMAQAQGEGQQGEGQQPGQEGQAGARDDDPLGRPTRGREMSDGRVRVPTADESAVQRARRIMEELRRKLGDPTRPQEELDYFERLLRRN